MNQEVLLLAGAALSVGVLHTAFGADHYVPFIAMARARQWSARKTALITVLCGLAHVLSSIALLALVQQFGGLLSISSETLNFVEEMRGNLVGWGLITVGVAYFFWGIREAFASPLRSRLQMSNSASLVVWSMMLVIVLGPCEPVLPFLLAPTSSVNPLQTALILASFSVATVGTMLTIVLVSVFGLARMRFASEFPLRRYAHSLAGAAIALCGVGVQFFGL